MELGGNRIEALTDGVFAVAMNRLVLDIKVPEFQQPLTTAISLSLSSSLDCCFARCFSSSDWNALSFAVPSASSQEESRLLGLVKRQRKASRSDLALALFEKVREEILLGEFHVKKNEEVVSQLNRLRRLRAIKPNPEFDVPF